MSVVRFTGITVWRASFDLRLTFSHNLASRDRVETLIVAIMSSNGGVGYGQALPRPYLTGETLETALADIRDIWWPALAEMTIPADTDFAAAVATLQPLFLRADASRKNASYAALDIAAMGAFSEGRGIAAGFGAPSALPKGRPLPLVGVISAASPGRAAWMARLMRWLGYRRFKVKVGQDPAADARRLEAVRKAVGTDAWLAVDANAAWSWSEAVDRMRGLTPYRVALVEEPLRADSAAADFSELERLTGMPVMADESLCTLADAASLLGRGSPSWWNVRLAKNGGFAGWANFSRLAREHGITLYGGILVGETAQMAAAARGAWSDGGVEAGEYGFPRVFLRGDPFRGGPGGFNGFMNPLPETTHGFGTRLLLNSLSRGAKIQWQNGTPVPVCSGIASPSIHFL